MKKALRVILPILLAIAIVFCLAWYLFVYDREFTRDMLLSAARRFEANGKHQTASWLYDCAYHRTAGNDAVAIELAEKHKAAGNFTQAEYTLSSAIADGGGVDLYVALCNTYVQQDKLLDAVTMLDNVLNPQIKAELDAMRPAAPTADTEPGFYSQYISVGFRAESGTLYVNAKGQYPSVLDTPYAEPITMEDGENTVYAVSVADNGLVSPLSIFGYTIGGVVEPLNFADSSIASAVRSLLNIPQDRQMFTNDLWDITAFTVPSEASNLADLRYFAFLEELTVVSGKEDQLQSISGLANLRKLTVTDTTVSPEELVIIGNLPMLKELILSNCRLTTTAGLENAEKLTYLDLSHNTIRNITPLATMTELEQLYLQDNTVTDISVLSGCTKLTKLDVSVNAISTLKPVLSIGSLRWINAAENTIDQITGIGNLTGLVYLSLADNALTDISDLAPCVNMVELNLSKNNLTDISVLSEMTQLTQFNFSKNQVSALPEWPKDASLVQIDGSDNLLESLDALGGLQYLNNVFMDNNPDIESVQALARCPMLIQVNVFGTKVTDVRALTNMSVIVNFNPVQS